MHNVIQISMCVNSIVMLKFKQSPSSLFCAVAAAVVVDVVVAPLLYVVCSCLFVQGFVRFVRQNNRHLVTILLLFNGF